VKESDLKYYQKFSINKIMDNPKFGLLLDMGLGKTVISLTAIRRLMFEELEIRAALVVAPKRVAEKVWMDEVNNWEHLKDLRIVCIKGTAKQRFEILKSKADVYTISRDNLAWLVQALNGVRMPFDMLVLDELSSYKNPSTIRFKSLRSKLPLFKRVVGLTGTPAPNGLVDLWSQIYLLDSGQRLGKYVTEYKNRFFHMQREGGYTTGFTPKSGAAERICEIISDITTSMSAKDFLDLPERIEIVTKVQMSAAEKATYKKMERESFLAHEGEEITAINGAALAIKLCQLANGAVYSDTKDVVEIHRAKLDALEERIEAANGNNVLVAWAFQHDRDRIIKRFPEARPIHSNQDIDDWNAGKIKIGLMHPASGGHGLNLQFGGHITIWFGLPRSLELYLQLNARLARPGQQHVTTLDHIIVQGTIDEKLMKALLAKEDVQNALLFAVKAKYEEMNTQQK
jgi:SNF2 family DNA or RNA helicase